MTRSLRLSTSGLLLLPSLAFAQSATELVPFEGEVHYAGTYDVVAGRLRPAASDLLPTNGVVYNNTCAFSGGNFFSAIATNGRFVDDGRIPSETSPAPNAGTLSEYWVREFQISYVTRELDAGLGGTGTTIVVDFFEDADVCVVPGAATASFTLTALPGSTAQGTAIGWTVNLNLVGGAEFLLRGDADGVHDGVAASDTFGYGLSMPAQVGPGTQGFFMRGDTIAPGNCGVGDGTYYKSPGAGFGTGLDNLDAFLSEPANTCNFFGGESAANPRGAFHRRITADIEDCNDNGRSDAADITLASSPDDDSNGVPDECEGVIGNGFCFGDGLDAMVTAACPCGNVGAPGQGCGNSFDPNGALLSVSGTQSPNTLLLTCSGIPNSTLCVFLRAQTNDPAGFLFGDGVSCLTGTLIRFGSQSSASHMASTGTVTIPAGNTRYYACHYRNLLGTFCPPQLFNISNGFMIQW